MKIFNTMTKQKERFNPINSDTAKIYACGPTVYNKIHIGNARQICVFDVLRRYLEYRGYKVFYVQNFTDVDDKIIKMSNENGINALEYSDSMIREYFIDAHGLNVSDADIHPKVTENMEIIIDIIKTLIEKGFAYKAGGDVYFRAAKFTEYGKLSHMPLDDLRAGASERISESDLKEDSMDFALWKTVKDGEPYWESPFGKGRPGWHIECSAMSRHYIGDTIDIHGGGSDLIFPHHENEIAQSECVTGHPLANIWMHNAMLNVDSKKMSKSKNNFFLVRELAELYGYEPIRFMLLSAHYRSQLNYTTEVIESAKNSLSRLFNCKRTMQRAISGVWNKESGFALKNGEASEATKKITEKRRLQFIEAMDDDLNTADGISAIFEFVRDINTQLQNNNVSIGDVDVFLNAFNELTGVLGILYENTSNENNTENEIPNQVQELVEKRKEARKNKDFKAADTLRDEITALGYIIEETRQGTVIRKS